MNPWRRLRRAPLPERVPRASVIAAARHVDVSLGGTRILLDVSLDVRTGEVLALVGPNGAGKSTMLSVFAGDIRPDGGDVSLHSRPVREWSPVDASRRRSVLLQQVALSFPFTVAEVVAMGCAPWANTSRADDDEKAVAEVMACTDVEAFTERRFGSLSGGERARVALARVLAQRTQLLLLDEPTAALDLRHQELVLAVARDRAAAGAAVVVVLHDLNLAAAHADRVALLSAGRLMAVGPPPEVLTAELLSEVYQHDVEVLEHPRSLAPIILPARRGGARVGRPARWPGRR